MIFAWGSHVHALSSAYERRWFKAKTTCANSLEIKNVFNGQEQCEVVHNLGTRATMIL